MRMTSNLGEKVDKGALENVLLGSIKSHQFPDFLDAKIVYAEIKGQPLTFRQLDWVNEDYQLVYEYVLTEVFKENK